MTIATHRLLVHTPDRVFPVDIPESMSVRLALDIAGIRVRAACGGLATCGACTIQTLNGRFSPETVGERQKISPAEREKNIRLACQLYVLSDAEVYLHNPAPESNWKSFDTSNWPDTVVSTEPVGTHRYGIAVDLGTTHIRLSLWDLRRKKRIACRQGVNPQTAYGEDVLTRLNADAQRGEVNQSLCQIVRCSILEGIRDILARDLGEIKPILKKIDRIHIVGNTTMLCLLSGQGSIKLFEPENWERPIACRVQDLESWKTDWRMPDVSIDIHPSLAGFIGSDTLADLMAVNIIQNGLPVMLVDFGTNTEIALWDGKTIRLTSVPGGSAFEGIGLANGVNAESGAIRAVYQTDGRFTLDILADRQAKGFCSTGFIDALALLRAENIVKLSGRFAVPTGESGYVLDPAQTHSAILSTDIDAFQRAKAATAAAMEQLLVSAGIPVKRIEEFWICGNLGQNINLEHAKRLGLIPMIDNSRVKLFDNAALCGCEKMLLDTGSNPSVQAIRQNVQVFNLSYCPDYEDRFINHLRLQPFSELE